MRRERDQRARLLAPPVTGSVFQWYVTHPVSLVVVAASADGI